MIYKIKEFRQEMGMTQKDLANKSHVSQNLIAQLESGSIEHTSTQTLVKLANALDRPVETLFFEK
ncbi:MAG: helix-turn-helix transcriptional regulator [Bacilli bacterium]